VSWPPDLKSKFDVPEDYRVRCACGRTVNADMMLDVRCVQKDLGITDYYRCDSCMEHFYRTGALTREAYCVAAGAPAAVVARVAARHDGVE
jgi:hypothetical protein